MSVEVESHSHRSSSVIAADSCDNPNGSWKYHGQHYYWVTTAEFGGGGGTGNSEHSKAQAECQKVSGGKIAEILDRATLEFFHDELHAAVGGKICWEQITLGLSI